MEKFCLQIQHELCWAILDFLNNNPNAPTIIVAGIVIFLLFAIIAIMFTGTD